MLQINFYPESNKEEYIKAVKEYQNIWDKKGIEIVAMFEKYSGLKFKQRVIKALIFEDISTSRPLRLRSSWDFNMKKAALTHELAHIILFDNNFYFPGNFGEEDFTLKSHQAIYLFLYDVWVGLFGEKFAETTKDRECGNPVYKKAWKWALSFSKETRAIKLKEITSKYQKT